MILEIPPASSTGDNTSGICQWHWSYHQPVALVLPPVALVLVIPPVALALVIPPVALALVIPPVALALVIPPVALALVIPPVALVIAPLALVHWRYHKW